MSEPMRWLRHKILNSGMYNAGAKDMECPYCHNEVPVYPKEGFYNATGCIKCGQSIYYLNEMAVLDTKENREVWRNKFVNPEGPLCRLCGYRHLSTFPEPTTHSPIYLAYVRDDGKPMKWKYPPGELVLITPEIDREDGWYVPPPNALGGMTVPFPRYYLPKGLQ